VEAIGIPSLNGARIGCAVLPNRFVIDDDELFPSVYTPGHWPHGEDKNHMI